MQNFPPVSRSSQPKADPFSVLQPARKPVKRPTAPCPNRRSRRDLKVRRKSLQKPTPCCPPPSDTAFAVPQGGGHRKIILQQIHKKICVSLNCSAKSRSRFHYPIAAAITSLHFQRSGTKSDRQSIHSHPPDGTETCLSFPRVLHDRKFPRPPPYPTEWDREGDHRGWIIIWLWLSGNRVFFRFPTSLLASSNL